MATLKEFEDMLREHGMQTALALLQRLRDRDRAKRSVSPARRITGRKMTPELARRILEMHATSNKTQQEIAFELGINQGRVNEVIKHRKWLTDDPSSPEAVARDRALARASSSGSRRSRQQLRKPDQPPPERQGRKRLRTVRSDPAQLAFGEF